MPIGAMAPLVMVNGIAMTASADADALVSIRVDRAFGLVGRATLRFREVNYKISASDKFKIGTEVEVSVPTNDVDRPHARSSGARSPGWRWSRPRAGRSS